MNKIIAKCLKAKRLMWPMLLTAPVYYRWPNVVMVLNVVMA